ncbi:hypothetical protein SLEP1_g49668 [Rubroshorea leprosula]|uniref:Retrotransposon gag domain-containing protein n=1 Tax=Rubroshorea leprosula TaxID=152421 RepID=A0AAV5LYV1_9ROSI|nr:hypothetical protein SLEP1_g49668 [Rubroshorea leprosula]
MAYRAGSTKSAVQQRLCEFSKSLFDRAYTWYPTLLPNSIHSWDEMVEQFFQKYFQNEERITILDLHNTCQHASEDLVVYVKRFRDLALDCHGGHAESFLVEICINNMLLAYCAVLKNIGIDMLMMHLPGLLAVSSFLANVAASLRLTGDVIFHGLLTVTSFLANVAASLRLTGDVIFHGQY